MCNNDTLQNLEDTLFEVEHLVTTLDKVTFTEHHAQQLMVLRQFMYGVIYETSIVIRSNSTKYY